MTESTNVKIKIQGFGSMKDFLKEGSVELSVSLGTRSEDVLIALENRLEKNILVESEKRRMKNIVAESVLASEERVLDRNERIDRDCNLAILPPVCGG